MFLLIKSSRIFTFIDKKLTIHPTKMTCSSSSSHNSQYICDKAIDGDLSTEWATKGEQVGAWIKIVFNHPYRLSKIRIMHRPHGSLVMFEDISLTFSDGTTENFTLGDEKGEIWNDVVLSQQPTSTFVKITAKVSM